MSRYARVLERINTAVSQTGGHADASAQHSAATLLPHDGAWRQELERLRGAVLLAHQMHGVQVILICSARTDDGATSVAASLALTLAELERTPVALVDLSQREPDTEPSFDGLLPGRPLKEIFPSGSSLSVLQTRVRNLYLVAGAQTGHSPMSLIQPVDLLRRLRERFKFVIVNAPPVMAHADTALLATKADTVMLMARADKSRLEELEAAKSEFERVGANILGVVLSQRKEHLPKLLADRV